MRLFIPGLVIISLCIGVSPELNRIEAKRTKTNMGTAKTHTIKTSSGSAKASKQAKGAVSKNTALTDKEEIEMADSEELDRIRPFILFSGYDHKASASDESVCITNNSDITLSSLTLDITYLDTQGRMIHRRDVSFNCNIPPGETRTISFRHYDRHKTLYYVRSTAPRSGGMPYDILISIKEAGFPL